MWHLVRKAFRKCNILNDKSLIFVSEFKWKLRLSKSHAFKGPQQEGSFCPIQLYITLSIVPLFIHSVKGFYNGLRKNTLCTYIYMPSSLDCDKYSKYSAKPCEFFLSGVKYILFHNFFYLYI